ncbi:nucleotide-binding domain-containing protein [Mollisia scopiformis]|uniref:Nucleotide-binding domain-containing protein n=1 Tax=Mollisia scopiformis TaxID=149040 RepID=A0A132B3P0_MOLSC|nr:nucleotide-binding domain-containing protein [Mollisia scopiformis]KUJ06287.1 nucleotide-binding domain-containing protein [Mollisia scopiformis]
MSHIIILGAGVTGLQTAISLLSSPSTSNYKVTVIASHVPGDRSSDYTSPWAGGDWRSSASLSLEDSEVREWDKKTYDHWMMSLDDSVEEETTEAKECRLGLGRRMISYFWGADDSETTGHDGSGLWWKNDVRDFKILNLEDKIEVPKGGGAVFGIEFQSVCINVPRYLEILLDRAKNLGANVVRKEIKTSKGLVGVVRDAKQVILALVNCSGLSARNFVTKAEADRLFPIRGQTVLVKGEAKMGRSYTKIPNTNDQEVLYVIPRPGSGTTMLGGCKQSQNWNCEVDNDLSERILDRVKREGLAEELRSGKGGEFEVISAQVGLRPGRHGGPRVELEKNGPVEDIYIVHAYGHAGAGYQNSVGSAEKVTKIIRGLV